MPIEVIVLPTEYQLIITSVVAMGIQPCPQIPAQIGEFLATILFLDSL
jgi:hypothetical protein